MHQVSASVAAAMEVLGYQVGKDFTIGEGILHFTHGDAAFDVAMKARVYGRLDRISITPEYIDVISQGSGVRFTWEHFHNLEPMIADFQGVHIKQGKDIRADKTKDYRKRSYGHNKQWSWHARTGKDNWAQYQARFDRRQARRIQVDPTVEKVQVEVFPYYPTTILVGDVATVRTPKHWLD
jgi:hypothetical protein